jgi:hypothetical protein
MNFNQDETSVIHIHTWFVVLMLPSYYTVYGL